MNKQTNKSIISEKPYDLEPNVEAALSYLIPPFTGIAVYIMEKKNKFVRFHALQSILFGISAFVLNIVANALVFLFIGIVLGQIVNLVLFLTWLFVIWKAYENEEFLLPIIGRIAKDQVSK